MICFKMAPPLTRVAKIPVLIGLATCITSFGCTRHVDVEKKMTWECAPEEYKQSYYARPDEYARFRFVEDPHCFELESAKDLCSELRQIGKPTVSARFEVWGGRFLAARGYRITSIEGRPLVDVGGWGSSGANDPIGRCPIGIIIDDLSK